MNQIPSLATLGVERSPDRTQEPVTSGRLLFSLPHVLLLQTGLVVFHVPSGDLVIDVKCILKN